MIHIRIGHSDDDTPSHNYEKEDQNDIIGTRKYIQGDNDIIELLFLIENKIHPK